MNREYLDWRLDDPRLNHTEAWLADRFPAAKFRYFRECGCLVCALAVMLRHHGIEETEDEDRFNPWILNTRLIDCGAFDAAADLELLDIRRLYPLEYLGDMPYSWEALARAAEQGLPCLITVPGKNAELHFTTLCRMLEDDAVVYDPCCGERRLSTYDEICEIRTFKPADVG